MGCGRLTSLRGHHYVVIIITTLLPAIVVPITLDVVPESLVLQLIIYLGAFIIWSLWSVFAVASMLKTDRFEAEQQVNQKVEALSGRISSMKEDHEESKADLRQQVENLEEVVRSTFQELGIVLQPRRISLRAKVLGGRPSLSVANVTVIGGSKVARIRQWFKSAMRRLWAMVYGKPKDN